MPSILPIGNRWRAQVRRRGQSISKTFRTKAAAESWAREREVEIDHGGVANPIALTVSDLIVNYRSEREKSGRPIAQRSNEHYILKRLTNEFRGHVAAKLTTDQIVKFAQKRRQEGAGGYTVDMDVSKLGTVMRHMASILGITLPDAAASARPALRHLRLIEAGKARDRRPTAEEIEKIHSWFAENPQREQAMPDLMRVAIQCAFRRGELFNLRWDDIDHEHHLALVRDRKHPRKKAGNDEWVPLIGDAYEILMRQPRYAVPESYLQKRAIDSTLPPHRNEFIFRFDKGTASKYFKQACDACGIIDLHFHDLRHEATSTLFEAGWQIPEVAAVTGHKDWRHLRRYTNLNPASVARKGRSKSNESK